MQSSRLWLLALMGVIGACTGTATSSTTVSAPSTTSTLPVTTQPATTTTTLTVPTTTTLALPDEPRVSAGWSLQPGDVLVANRDGVSVVRNGEIVSQPVTSPVEAALAEHSGSIVFVTPDPDLFPRHWPERGKGGGYFIWRLQPDGTLIQVLRTDRTIDGPLGAVTLYQAPVIGKIAAGFTTPIFKVAREDAWGERVHLAPAGNFNGVGGGIRVLHGEGGITGVAWQESDNRLIVSVATDGGTWLEARDFDDPVPVDWPSEWPTNPVPEGTACADDESFNHCLDTVTTLPGTTLIAYTETNSERTLTDLIIYDTETGTELRRIPVAEFPEFVKQLHASGTEIAVSLMTYRDLRYQYLPTQIIDIEAWSAREIPWGGVTTIVPGSLPGG